MSVAAVYARVSELQRMIAPQPVTPLEATTGGALFADQLAAAQQATPATAPAAPTTVSPAAPAGGSPYEAEIATAAARHGIDPALLRAVVRAESGFNPNAVSSAGAQGLTQLMPATAAGLGVTDPFDPAQALDGGAKYLRSQLDAFGGDVTKALAAYNAGPGAVQKYGGVPPYAETQAYVQKILGYMAEGR